MPLLCRTRSWRDTREALREETQKEELREGGKEMPVRVCGACGDEVSCVRQEGKEEMKKRLFLLLLLLFFSISCFLPGRGFVVFITFISKPFVSSGSFFLLLSRRLCSFLHARTDGEGEEQGGKECLSLGLVGARPRVMGKDPQRYSQIHVPHSTRIVPP